MQNPSANGAVLAAPTRSAAVAAALRERILSGELEPGSRLRQASLAERLGVSTTPVREALLALEREGLVRQDPQRGASVWIPDRDELQELYEIRIELEALAAGKAAGRLNAERYGELAATLRAMRDAPNTARYLELNALFHERLYRAAERPNLAALIANLRNGSRGYLRLYGTRQQNNARIDEEHHAMLAACLAGKPRAAAAATRAHLRHSLSETLAAIDARNQV
jgi:DNA-binding GntR family transcriptional regulator